MKDCQHTDHKPLVSFLRSANQEGIYATWAADLRQLHCKITYIPGPRNKVADSLSRTLFFDEGCHGTPEMEEALSSLKSEGGHWVWKDGKGGFEEFLRTLNDPERQEVIDDGTWNGVNVFMFETNFIDSWKEYYDQSDWFGDVFRMLNTGLPIGTPNGSCKDKNALDFRFADDRLWKWDTRLGEYLLCIPEGRVRQVLEDAHDRTGHWEEQASRARLVRRVYWLKLSDDVRRYIRGCRQCARYAVQTQRTPNRPVLTFRPFDLIGMNFIGPLPATTRGNRYILHFIEYFSSYSVAFATHGCKVHFYVDPGHHFKNWQIDRWRYTNGIKVEYRPTGASRSTGKIEIPGRIIQDVLVRMLDSLQDWDLHLRAAVKQVNDRILKLERFSPAEILLGTSDDRDSFTYHPHLNSAELTADEIERDAGTTTHMSNVLGLITYHNQVDEVVRNVRKTKDNPAAH